MNLFTGTLTCSKGYNNLMQYQTVLAVLTALNLPFPCLFRGFLPNHSIIQCLVLMFQISLQEIRFVIDIKKSHENIKTCDTNQSAYFSRLRINLIMIDIE